MNDGNRDVFVRKYDSSGVEQWTRLFGTTDIDYGYGISADESAIYVAGITRGTLPGQTSEGGLDGFIRKYDADGVEEWTRQFGTSDTDMVNGIAAGDSGVYVTGYSRVVVNDSPCENSFLIKYSVEGTEQWTREITSITQPRERAEAVSSDEKSTYWEILAARCPVKQVPVGRICSFASMPRTVQSNGHASSARRTMIMRAVSPLTAPASMWQETSVVMLSCASTTQMDSSYGHVDLAHPIAWQKMSW